jgi:hypothetical protein
MRRPSVPSEVEADVVTLSRRRCCICFGLKRDDRTKKGQIAHLDGNRANNKIGNLAWLCLPHHDDYDSTTSQSKNYTIREVKRYRKELYDSIMTVLGSGDAKSYRARDLRQLTSILSMLNSSVIDRFIHNIQFGHIDLTIFHFWEAYNSILTSSVYQIHDQELDKLMKAFHKAWGKCLSFGEWFTPTANYQILRLLTQHEIHSSRYKQWKTVIDKIGVGSTKLNGAYKALLQYVKKIYPEVELSETDKAAWRGYKDSVSEK